MNWKVRVVGSSINKIEELSRLLQDSSISLCPDSHGSYYLSGAQFDGCLIAKDAIETCEGILLILIGVAKLACDETLDLSVSGALEEKSDGTKQFHMHFFETLNVRVTESLTVIDSDGTVVEELTPSKPVSAWLDAGVANELIGKLFRLYGKDHDWVGLYRIFEVIEADAGGVDGIARQGWATKSQMRRFKHTANSSATGDESRHAKPDPSPPTDPMPIEEARSLVQEISRQFLAAAVKAR